MPKSFDPLTDIPDLTGKVAVVTGGNAGIGLSTVKFLALRGAKVYFTARSESKANHVYSELMGGSLSIKREQLVWLRIDLADLKSVKTAIEELKRRESEVDILINNAGMATATEETVGDRWEMHMAVCHVGHFVFTNGILPLLKAASQKPGADVRIVTLSSEVSRGMFASDYQFRFDSPSFLAKPVSYYPWQWRYGFRFVFNVDMVRYGLAKVANVLFAQELQRILDEQGSSIISVSIHPGAVASEGAIAIGRSLLRVVSKRMFISTDQGAWTSLFAATSPEVRRNADKFRGGYLVPYGEVAVPHAVAKNEAQVRGLWDNTTSEVQNHLQKTGQSPLLAW